MLQIARRFINGLTHDCSAYVARTLATPDGLYDLHTIAFAQRVLGVSAARHDFAIDFHRDAAIAVTGFDEQRGDRRRCTFVRLTVEKNSHPQSLTPHDAGRRASLDPVQRIG